VCETALCRFLLHVFGAVARQRGNVLLCEEFGEERYIDALVACGLPGEIARLADGDAAERVRRRPPRS
jgi:hypothetical protein